MDHLCPGQGITERDFHCCGEFKPCQARVLPGCPGPPAGTAEKVSHLVQSMSQHHHCFRQGEKVLGLCFEYVSETWVDFDGVPRCRLLAEDSAIVGQTLQAAVQQGIDGDLWWLVGVIVFNGGKGDVTWECWEMTSQVDFNVRCGILEWAAFNSTGSCAESY